ncbi:MAG: hypothetical protein J6T08_03965, partial [Lentisphaeria bacterium]|nr:hypothetical protein [Lentisphaeria bacterium]
AIFAPSAIAEAVRAPAIQYLYLAVLGIGSSAVAYVSWAKAFSKAGKTSQVSNYMFVTPFLTSILGFLLAVVSVKVSYYNPEIAGSRFAVLIPLIILAVPIFDALAVVWIRIRNGKPFYVGDNNHISHRFLHMGFSRAVSVMLVHLLALTIGLGALPILWGDGMTCALLLAQSVVFLTILSVVQCAGKQKEN